MYECPVCNTYYETTDEVTVCWEEHEYDRTAVTPDNLNRWVQQYERYVLMYFRQAAAHEGDPMYKFYLELALKDAAALDELTRMYDASCQQLAVLYPEFYIFDRIILE